MEDRNKVYHLTYARSNVKINVKENSFMEKQSMQIIYLILRIILLIKILLIFTLKLIWN